MYVKFKVPWALLARVTAVQSTSLFVSREQEVQIRACVVRRVSFLLFAAPTDYYLKQLPTIQEKLVELLKGPAGLMHVEVSFSKTA